MSRRNHHIHEGTAFPNDGKVIRSFTCTNLVQWTDFVGAFTTTFQGEKCVALEYGHTGGTVVGAGDIWTATFQSAHKIGPTVSGLCSACRTKACPSSVPTNPYYLKSSPSYQSAVTIQNTNFIGGGYNSADGNLKPSNAHILFGVWFDYTVEDPILGVTGVNETGIGAGDILYIEGVGANNTSRTWLLLDWNKRKAYNAGVPLEKSSSWNCGNVFKGTKAIWFEMPIRDYASFRISVRPPGWAKNPVEPNADTFAPPIGLRYYVAAYIVEACGLGQAQPGTVVGTADAHSHRQLKAHRVEEG